MVKVFKEAEIKKMLGWVTADQMSFSRMVEILNQKANNHATSVAKQALENAAENASAFLDANDNPIVAKGSILDDKNIPEL